MKYIPASKKLPYLVVRENTQTYYVRAYWEDHPRKPEFIRSLRVKVGDKNLTEVERIAREIYQEWASDGRSKVDRVRKKGTVEYAARQYLGKLEALEKSGKRRESTIYKVRSILRTHIIPTFGDIRITGVTSSDWLAYLATDPPRVQETWVYLGAILKQAQRDGLLEKVPELEKPRPSEYEGVAYTLEQVKKIQSVMKPREAFHLFLNLGLHGMRANEIRTLAWGDIKKGVITLRPENVKTKAGRSFPVAPRLAEMLQERRKGSEGTFVFPQGKVDAPATENFFRPMKAMAEGIDSIPEYRHHFLRHTFLTHAAKAIKNRESDFSAVEICQFAGLSIDTFMRHYLHLQPTDLEGVAKSIWTKFGQ